MIQVGAIDYAEIKPCTHCGQIKPYCDDKVQYTNIGKQVEIAGEL